jgi:hypothetical protein
MNKLVLGSLNHWFLHGEGKLMMRLRFGRIHADSESWFASLFIIHYCHCPPLVIPLLVLSTFFGVRRVPVWNLLPPNSLSEDLPQRH